MKIIVILLTLLTPSNEITMDSTNVEYPENIEHCERMFYTSPEERTYWDQCDAALTLHYIINK